MVLKAESKEAGAFLRNFRSVTGDHLERYFLSLDIGGFNKVLNQHPKLRSDFFAIPEVMAEIEKRKAKNETTPWETGAEGLGQLFDQVQDK